ncbi:MAG: SWIM zinc finger family protein [Clostridia bacterium]|nr:SWIM zinc finger family protein [Clostridia bacterium]
MGLLNLASAASVWRGYEYYKYKRIFAVVKLSESEYAGKSEGSDGQFYDVRIDIAHPRKSNCNCPHANGKRVVCKHQIALYFTLFPDEAQNYYDMTVRYREEEEKRQEEIENKVIKYINSLSKEELRNTLYDVLYDGPEWLFERFVHENIDY